MNADYKILVENQSGLGCFKLENEILKEAKNLGK